MVIMLGLLIWLIVLLVHTLHGILLAFTEPLDIF